MDPSTPEADLLPGTARPVGRVIHPDEEVHLIVNTFHLRERRYRHMSANRGDTLTWERDGDYDLTFTFPSGVVEEVSGGGPRRCETNGDGELVCTLAHDGPALKARVLVGSCFDYALSAVRGNDLTRTERPVGGPPRTQEERDRCGRAAFSDDGVVILGTERPKVIVPPP